MASLHRLTPRQIASFSRDGIYADGGGLHLRVRGAARHYLYIYHLEGRRREMGLGAPPAVSLKVARERAQAARELVAAGGDPIAEKRSLVARPTFGVLADAWIEARRNSVRNSKSVDRWQRVLGERGYAATLRPIRVDQIDTRQVLSVLEPIWSKGPTATLARGYLEAVLDAAGSYGHRAGENPARWKGHLENLLTKPAKLARGHHAALPYADVPGLMSDLRGRDTVTARYLEFVILSAARAGEALGATWDEFDFEKDTWTLPAERMKAGRPHIVPLTPQMRELLESLERPTPASLDQRVFAVSGKLLSNMAAPMMLRRMGQATTLHGFRSSFRDWAGDCTDYPRELAEAALAHALGTVEAAYRRSSALEKRRAMMADWKNYCLPVT